MLAISNIIQGVISSIIVTFMISIIDSRRYMKAKEDEFVQETGRLVRCIEYNINRDIDLGLLNKILLKESNENTINISDKEKRNVIKAMKRVIKLKESLSLRSINLICFEYNSNWIVKKNLLYKSREEDMKYIYDEIVIMVDLIRNISFDFEVYFNNMESYLEDPKDTLRFSRDPIILMVEFLSKIYYKMYELKYENNYSVYYNMWNYNMEDKIYSFNKVNIPKQELPDIRDYIVGGISN